MTYRIHQKMCTRTHSSFLIDSPQHDAMPCGHDILSLCRHSNRMQSFTNQVPIHWYSGESQNRRMCEFHAVSLNPNNFSSHATIKVSVCFVGDCLNGIEIRYQVLRTRFEDEVMVSANNDRSSGGCGLLQGSDGSVSCLKYGRQ